MELSSREEGDPFSRGLKRVIFSWWVQPAAGQVKLKEL
jgi:hypothetical protein